MTTSDDWPASVPTGRILQGCAVVGLLIATGAYLSGGTDDFMTVTGYWGPALFVISLLLLAVEHKIRN